MTIFVIVIATAVVLILATMAVGQEIPQETPSLQVDTGTPDTNVAGQPGLLSPSDIAGFASDAGFQGVDLVTAVAIALAESLPPGNPKSYNPEIRAQGGTPEGKGSYGLWQIYLKVHPEFSGWNLYDPSQNAAAAFDIYSRAGGFSPWSSYTSRHYQSFVADAQQGVSA